MIVASTTMCDDDASMTKRWAPPGPPDAFDVADATLSVSCGVATRGGRGGRSGGWMSTEGAQ